MWRYFVWLGLSTSLAAAAGAQETRGKQPLRDARLSHQVTLRHRFVTVGELLHDIGAATGVPRRARSPVDAENVTALISDRPAREVLEVLGETLGYGWRRFEAENGGEGYELYLDREGQLKEERLRSRRRAEGVKAIDRYLRERHQQAAAAEKAIDALIALDVPERSGLPEPERKELVRRREELVARAKGSLPRQFTEFLRLAPKLLPQAREAIMSGQLARFSSQRRPGFRPLAAPVAAAIVAERARDAAWAAQARTAKALEVKCFLGARWEARRLALVLGREIVLTDAVKPTHLTDSPAAGWFEVPCPADPPGEDELLRPVDSRLATKIALELPPKKARLEDPSTYVRFPTLVDLLERIHAAERRLCFVGDAHLRKLEIPADPTPRSLWEILNLAASAHGSSLRWDPRGYVGFRSKTYFEDRPGSVPAPVLREMAARGVRSGRLTLMDYAWLAARLNDHQVDHTFGTRSLLSEWQLPAGFSPVSLSSNRRELRIIASLRAEQLAVLKNGDTLRCSALTPAQRAAVRTALNESLQEFDGFRFWTEPEVSMLGLRMHARHDAPEVLAQPTDFHYVMEGVSKPVIERTMFF